LGEDLPSEREIGVTQTLHSMLFAGAALSRGQPALIECRGRDYVPVSHEALQAAAASAGQTLGRFGVGAGDVVGVWLANGLDYLALEFAAAAAGAAVLGVNTRYGAFELSHLLATAAFKVLALPGQFLDIDFPGRLAEAFAEARRRQSDLPAPVVIICGEAAGDLRRFDLGQSVARLGLNEEAPVLIDRGSPEAPVNYFTTSGSTGAPKLAGHDQAAIAIHAALAATLFDIKPADVVLGVLPFCGVFGFNVAMSALASGASLLVDPVFDAKRTLTAMARFGVTHAFGGDDLWGRLHEIWTADPVDLPRLRRGAIAQFEGRAEPLGAWARERLGVELTGLYGSSELMSFVLTRPLQSDVGRQVRGGGRPISDRIELRLADPETGEVTSAGQGELQARGYNRLTHYLGNPEASAQAITADGWYRTGDLLSADGDGGYTFLCRNTEALRLRGFLVEPAEIEQCLTAHPGVEAARVVGVREPLGERPVGFVVVSDKTLTGEALVSFCRSRLAAYKTPALVVILEAFPVTAGTNGVKIRLDELKRMAQRSVFPRAVSQP
jgi:fatty-acyl-CoA synthase